MTTRESDDVVEKLRRKIEDSPNFDIQPDWERPLSITSAYEDKANQRSGSTDH
jgi:hypothetical protein